MKNLKKILSLVLALAMALSLMTVAFAKDTGDFADGDDVTYAEAVDVMATVGVFNGVGDGSNFDPKGTLTREQAAKIITYMIMGQAQADKLVATIAPFADVSADRWSAGAIAYCASEGIMNGTGNGKFNPTGELTGLQFAKMLLVALGYDAEIEDMTGAAWGLATSKLAYAVELDDGMDDINLTDVMTREQAAQMALTTMKTPLVEYPDKGATIKVNGAVVEFGAQKAQYVTSEIAREQTISNVQLTNGNGYTVEFGEKYCQKLVLNGGPDVFGAPSYTWTYDKKEINTYEDDSDLVAEFTTKVTGKDLYDAITKNVMDHLNDFDVYIDGETSDKVNTAIFGEGAISRSNTDAVGATEKGVLTQVFVENVDNKGTTVYDVTIVIKNTYLAIASEDYDTKNEDVNLDVYALDKVAKFDKDNPQYIKNTIASDKAGYVEKTSVTVKNDDIDVADVKEDEMYLVTVADGKIQEMIVPEVVSDATINSFRLNKDVSVDGTTYEYAHTARYDVEVLNQYSNTNLKNITYNVILDPYGYLIGIEQNEDPDTYLFLAGMEGNTSDLSTKNADANVIFLDGTVKTVTVNVSKSDDALMAKSGPQMNTWCTYSVSSDDVYTLKEVADDAFPTKGTKVAQSKMDADQYTGGSDGKWGDANKEIKIDKKNVSLVGLGTSKVYGNNDTVYLNVSTKSIKAANPHTDGKPWTAVIDDVDSVTVGVRNASLVAKDQTAGDGTNKKDTSKTSTPAGNGPYVCDNEIYPLFKDNGYIIAAVVIGDDDGVNKSYAYVTSSNVKREGYDKTTDKWTWTREAVVDGKLVDLKEIGGGTDLSDLKDMEQGAWYEVKFDADGNVKSAEKLTFADDGEKYPATVAGVPAAIADNNSVVLFDQTFTATIGADDDDVVTYRNGTLYVATDDVKGFDVSPDVKTVVCLSDDGDAFDDVDDRYEGYTGLENAIRNLDSNFKGHLSAIFENGSATVIIFNDLSDGKMDGGNADAPSGENGVDVNVVAKLGFDGTTSDSGAVYFVATGTDKITGAAKREAVKTAYVDEYGVAASKTEVKYEDKKDGTMVYNVYVDGVLEASYAEGASVGKLVAVPTAKKLWDNLFPNGAPEGEGEHNENTQNLSYAALYNGTYGNFVSWDAEFTPTVADDGTVTIDITGIDWISDLDSEVPGFYYDRDVVGGNNYTIKQAYLTSDADAAAGSISVPADNSALRGTLSAKNIKSFAIIPMISAKTGQNIVNIYFKDADGNIYRQTGDQITGDGSTAWTSTSGHYGPTGVTTTIIPH